ncbi:MULTISPECIES: ankyrin repeat domain-containing protein [unclassified Streptomyces]|uniref:ankyrin repeat domain-containing protein n=1 Tax=unclassified Streptomyces TaxID=2593676 RepID=UPI00225833EC|nr:MULTISPECIES: ankyrin repeat domain-containing protein [unclassified Streptomyces]MCX4529660.1 ankyrin repeat domain-containing protein [Streptomyces sp. NBC_01551]MCX4539768.1 ankyrin repeat domain-containing protein [Streptomyces sp. NBC_01565]
MSGAGPGYRYKEVPEGVLPGGIAPEDVSTWQRIRRYAVPGWMIERATAHRLAGDWRAACAAAAVDVRFEPADIASRYGASVAEALEDDLRHLAPDLLRWHLPRGLGGRTTIATDLRVLLATYGTAPGAPSLSVSTSAMTEGPQRLRLLCEPVDPVRPYVPYSGFLVENWTAARPLWDARRAGALRELLGAGDGRLPFFHADGTPLRPDELPRADPGAADPAGNAEWITLLQSRGDSREAYAAAGVERDLTAPERTRTYGRPADPEAVLATNALDLTRLRAGVRRLAAAGAGAAFRVSTGYLTIRLDAVGEAPHGPDGPVRARYIAQRDEAARLARLPEYAWKRLPDLELVRLGRITPRELHPLVTDALFPGAGPAVGPPGPAEGKPVRVRCRGGWHEVRSRGGLLEMPHTPEEQQRERALRAFGGAVTGCFAVEQTWITGEGRLPRALRAEHRDFFLRVQHGDTPGVLALLDAGVSPRIRDGRRRGLLHALHLLDHEQLLPRLLAAGLDLESQDVNQRTPLQSAVHWGGSADLVRALLAAGSRIDVVDDMELSLSQDIRRYKRTDLAFLRRRADEEFPGIGADWWDEYMEESAYDEDPSEPEDPEDGSSEGGEDA